MLYLTRIPGTSVSVYGSVGPGNGAKMGFSIDQFPIILYIAPAVSAPMFHQALWTSPTLPDGTHTLTITQNSTDPTNVIFLDYLIYTTESTAGKTLFIDDNDVRVQYSAGWSASSQDNRYFQQTLHASQVAGCWVSFTFEGLYLRFL